MSVIYLHKGEGNGGKQAISPSSSSACHLSSRRGGNQAEERCRSYVHSVPESDAGTKNITNAQGREELTKGKTAREKETSNKRNKTTTEYSLKSFDKKN